MSINNVNQGIDIQKLLKSMNNGQVKKAGLSSKVPVHMTMNGSVFNMPGVNNSQNTQSLQGSQSARTTQNVVSANTAKSVANVSTVSTTSTTSATSSTQAQNNANGIDINQYDYDNLTAVGDGDLKLLKQELTELKNSDIPRFLENSVKSKLDKVNSEISKRSEGKSGYKQDLTEADGDTAVSDSKDSSNDSKAATNKTEAGTSQMEKSQSEMKSLDKKMKTDENKFKKQMKAGEKSVAASQKEIAKETENLAQKMAQMDSVNAQIEAQNAILSSDSASQEQITAAQTVLASNSAKATMIQNDMGAGQVKIKKLQVSTNKKIRTLSRTSKNYQITAKKNTKAIQQEQSSSEKVLKVAEKADEIASYTTMAGQATQYIGKGMMIAGKAMAASPCPPVAAAGAAMITAGATTEKVGITVETVGNYGKCAANVTKTAVYTAQGNIKGALTSAGAAVMSGASAAKGTKEMGNGFKSVNEKAAQMSQEAATKAQVKAAQIQEKALAKNGFVDSGAQGKIDNLGKASNKLEANATKFQGKVDQANLGAATKELEKAKKQVSALGDKATAAQKENLTKLQDSVNKAGQNDFSGVKSVADGMQSNFEKSLSKGMQMGSFLQSAGSQFADNGTRSVGGNIHRNYGHRAQRRSFR